MAEPLALRRGVLFSSLRQVGLEDLGPWWVPAQAHCWLWLPLPRTILRALDALWQRRGANYAPHQKPWNDALATAVVFRCLRQGGRHSPDMCVCVLAMVEDRRPQRAAMPCHAMAEALTSVARSLDGKSLWRL